MTPVPPASPSQAVADEPSPSVWLHGSPRPWQPGLTLSALLQAEALNPACVATAVDALFIARPLRDTTQLQPGDQITVFHPITGG